MSVSTTPGAYAFTVIPYGAHSRAAVCVRLRIAALDMQYDPKYGRAIHAELGILASFRYSVLTCLAAYATSTNDSTPAGLYHGTSSRPVTVKCTLDIYSMSRFY